MSRVIAGITLVVLITVTALIGYLLVQLDRGEDRLVALEQLGDQGSEDVSNELDALREMVAELVDTQSTLEDRTTRLDEKMTELVGTQAGFVPPGTPSLVELAATSVDFAELDGLERRIATIEGDLIAVRFCLRNAVDAVELGTSYVSGCLII